MTLEELIHDMAARGELTHLSVIPHNDGSWAATFCCATAAGGFTTAKHKDPVEAMKLSITEAKVKRRSVHPKVTATVKENPPPEAPDPVEQHLSARNRVDTLERAGIQSTLEDFLPKITPRGGGK